MKTVKIIGLGRGSRGRFQTCPYCPYPIYTLRFFFFLIFVFFCNATSALDFTDTVYTVPLEKLGLKFKTSNLYDNVWKSRETFEFGAAITNNVSFWLMQDYLHPLSKPLDGVLGDSHLRIFFYFGEFKNEKFDMGLNLKFRFGTGPNMFSNDEYLDFAVGKNELKINPVIRTKISNNDFLFFNVGYVFREDVNESMYSGINLNLFSSSAYKQLFGLNIFSSEAFLSHKKMNNDYIFTSIAFITQRYYPIILYGEIYGSIRPYRGQIEAADIKIEGGRYNPIIFSGGARYAFSPDLFAGISVSCVHNFANNSKIMLNIDAGVTF